MFAATEDIVTPSNNVVLPGYTRLDAAMFFAVSEKFRTQLNIENLLDQGYFLNPTITTTSRREARVLCA